jgi:uncharacterized protein (TIGR02246 family)
MRHLKVLCVVIGISCSHAIAGPKEDALQVVERWAAAFTNSDVDGIVRLYSPDAMFIGTGSKAVALKPEEIREYFERALLSNRPRSAKLGEPSVLVLSDTAVVVAGLDTLTAVRDGKATSVNGRVTFVVAKRGPEWQIVHFHRSAMPS